MVKNIRCASVFGLEAYEVTIECFAGRGLPQFKIVGLPDASVKESLDRVASAIKSSGYHMPSGKIIINLSPSDIRKDGTHFDLAIAMGVVAIANEEDSKKLEDTMFLGELSLDGRLVYGKNILPIIIELHQKGIKSFVVPFENRSELIEIDGLEVFYAKTLAEAVEFSCKGVSPSEYEEFPSLSVQVEEDVILLPAEKDFLDVVGCYDAKRALEISVCGNHNLLMIGEPGIGKTMLLDRVGTILDSMTYKESLEISKIYGLHGMHRSVKDFNPPIRHPSYNISLARFIGGYSKVIPGEVSLSHKGVMILDEMSEFKTDVIESLRGILDNKKIMLRRESRLLEFPCEFLLMASTNPCKCGYLGSSKECRCTQQDLNRFHSRFSGPILDRIDMKINIRTAMDSQFLKVKDVDMEKHEFYSSKNMKQRIKAAREFQNKRNQSLGIRFNSELDEKLDIKYFRIDESANDLLFNILEKKVVSKRSKLKTIKIARTIADMELSEKIRSNHISEAFFLNNDYMERDGI